MCLYVRSNIRMQMTLAVARLPKIRRAEIRKLRWQTRFARCHKQQLFETEPESNYCGHLFMFQFISDLIQLAANLMHMIAARSLAHSRALSNGSLKTPQRTESTRDECKFRGQNLRPLCLSDGNVRLTDLWAASLSAPFHVGFVCSRTTLF